MKILNEFYPLTAKQIVSESKEKGTMTLRGLFQRAETTNRNKRIYSKSLLEREVNKLQPLIKEHRLVGELDHPSDRLNIRYSEASHKITNLWMKDNDVYGEIELLNTPKGQIAQELLKGGITLGISSRGGGSLTEIKEGEEPRWKVNEDFNLATFDLVPDESTIGATLGLMESATLGPKCKKIMERVNKERLFIKLLKDKIVEGKTYKDEEAYDDEGTDKPKEKRYKKATKALLLGKIKDIKDKLADKVNTDDVQEAIKIYLEEGSSNPKRVDRVLNSKRLPEKERLAKELKLNKRGVDSEERKTAKQVANRKPKNTVIRAREDAEEMLDNIRAQGNRARFHVVKESSGDWLDQEMARIAKHGLKKKEEKKKKKVPATETPENKEKRLRAAFEKMKKVEESGSEFLKKRTPENYRKIPQSPKRHKERLLGTGTIPPKKNNYRNKINKGDYIHTEDENGQVNGYSRNPLTDKERKDNASARYIKYMKAHVAKRSKTT